MDGRALWQRAGRLVGVSPTAIYRRGRTRQPTAAEAAALLEAAVAALEAAGVAVRVLNLDGYAVVMVRGGRWRNEETAAFDVFEHFVGGVRFEDIRPPAHAYAD